MSILEFVAEHGVILNQSEKDYLNNMVEGKLSFVLAKDVRADLMFEIYEQYSSNFPKKID